MRRPKLIPLLILPMLSSGCELMQYAAPHQLWKLNRQPAMGGEDAYFSIPAESVPTATSQGSNTDRDAKSMNTHPERS